MSETLLQRTVNDGDEIYYDSKFRSVLEDHLPIIRNKSATNIVAITPQQGYEFEGDFFSLCKSINVPEELIWLTMRINDMTANHEFSRDISEIILVDIDYLSGIVDRHKSTQIM